MAARETAEHIHRGHVEHDVLDVPGRFAYREPLPSDPRRCVLIQPGHGASVGPKGYVVTLPLDSVRELGMFLEFLYGTDWAPVTEVRRG